MPVRLERWDPAWGALSEQAIRRRLEAEGYAVTRYVYPPATVFPDHTHPVDKKDSVLRGRFKISAEGREIIMQAGDMVEIPAGTVHAARVLGDEPVVSFDATRPSSTK